MKVQSKELVAGSFVVGGLIGLLAIIAVLGDFMQRTDPYYTKVNNVAGLKKGAAVIYEGYIIGSVSGITPKPSKKVWSLKLTLRSKKTGKSLKHHKQGSLHFLSFLPWQFRLTRAQALPSSLALKSKSPNR